MIRSAVGVLVVAVIGGAAVYAYRSHTRASAIDPDAPVVAPIRLLDQNGEAVILLDSAARANSGLRFSALRTGADAAHIELRAVIVADPDAITLVRAPVSGRLSASAHPWPVYGEQLEAGGELGTVSDARPFTLSRGGTVTRVFARPGAVVQAGDPLLELTDFSHPVASVAWSESAPATPPSVLTLSLADRSGKHAARLLGPAPEADPVSRQPAYFYRLDEVWSSARPGLLLSARIAVAGGSVKGVLVPRAAVVQWNGLQWAWRKQGGSFVRVRVPTDRPESEGWLAGAPWQAGDTVVVVGAEQLLSEEFRAHVSVGDEVAE